MRHESFDPKTIEALRKSWGPVLGVWEGYANDDEIRFRGSSGGASTAISLYCLERGNVAGILQIGTSPDNALENSTVMSCNRDELLRCTGSRYSPAAPCKEFDLIKNGPGEYVFVGKPCDIVALRKAQAIDPLLKEKVFAAISIFCAGTPSTDGTSAVLKALDADEDKVEEFRYRGCGWPGVATAKMKDGTDARQMTYEQSWGQILSKHVGLRCRLCPDGTGEFADISCGDPWYREIEPGESGRSLLLARTEIGKEILKKVASSGYISIEELQADKLSGSQKGLLAKRQNMWGRLFVLRMLRIPVPVYHGFALLSNWLDLPFGRKVNSFGGTFRRAIQRKWRKQVNRNVDASPNIPLSSCDGEKNI
jgi:coenzyme F420 hydrogenase subunit beta